MNILKQKKMFKKDQSQWYYHVLIEPHFSLVPFLLTVMTNIMDNNLYYLMQSSKQPHKGLPGPSYRYWETEMLFASKDKAG